MGIEGELTPLVRNGPPVQGAFLWVSQWPGHSAVSPVVESRAGKSSLFPAATLPSWGILLRSRFPSRA